MTHYLIREMLPEERPRERLMAHGPEVLTTTELLAILIGSGRKDHSALDIARELTGDFLKDARLARTQDIRELTRTLWDTGKVMGIPLVDHLIIGDGVYYSFKEHGLL